MESDLRLTPDGRFLYARLSKDRGSRRYDTSTWQCTAVNIMPEVFSPDSKLHSTRGRPVIVLNVTDNKITNKGESFVGFNDHYDAVTNDGKKTVHHSRSKHPLSLTNRILISEIGNLRNLIKLSGHNGDPTAVVISPDGRLVAAGATDNSVRIWDMQTGSLLQSLLWHISPAVALAFTPDSAKLVSGSKDNSLAIWNVSNGKKLHELWGHKNEVLDIAVSPDGLHIASISYDGELFLWNLPEGKFIKKMASVELITDVSCRFSHDGKSIILAYGSHGGRIMIIDTASGQILVRKGCPLVYGCK